LVTLDRRGYAGVFAFSVLIHVLAGPPTAHGSDVPMVFDWREERYELTAQEQALGKQMRAYWAAFAANGDPEVDGAPQWPRFGTDGPIMKLTSAGSIAPPSAAAAADHHCDVWV
jgi:para-nitrobenzyl esterase